MTDVHINPKFKAVLDMPTENERKLLEAALVRDGGPTDPIVIWKDHGDIVDGHNRYEICVAHGLKFETREVEFKDEDAVVTWMLEYQLSRRNLTPLRFTYLIGELYNMKKAAPGAENLTSGAGQTDEKLAEQHGISPKSVRRAGDMVKGLETVAEVKGLSNIQQKLAAMTNKTVTKAEAETIGRIEDKDIAKDVVVNLENAKAAGMTGPDVVKAAVKVATEKKKGKAAPIAPAPRKEMFQVVFAAPDFDMSFNIANEVRPALAENSVLYLACPDEELPKGLEILKKWGMQYDCSFVFPIEGYEGTWSDIKHTNLLVGTKGAIVGPKKLHSSVMHTKGEPHEEMMKLVTSFHPKDKRLDLRKRGKPADGWTKPTN